MKFYFALSLTLSLMLSLGYAQTSAAPALSNSANICTDRGLKCCNKARGKRAQKILNKCQKKYKCQCPTTVSSTNR